MQASCSTVRVALRLHYITPPEMESTNSAANIRSKWVRALLIQLFARSVPENMSLQVASAAYSLIHYLIMKKQHWKRRWWQTEMFRNRWFYSGSNLLADLKFQEISFWRIYYNILDLFGSHRTVFALYTSIDSTVFSFVHSIFTNTTQIITHRPHR
jgi:hypothetical protein